MSTTTTRRLSPVAPSRDLKPRRRGAAQPAAAIPAVPSAPPSRPAAHALFDLRKNPGYYNAQARSGLLRRTARPPHDELLVDFSRPDCFIEMRAVGSPLLSGTWSFRAAAAGQSLAATGPWEESCWETDEECDFLEIELPLSGGWRIERQMLLARRDRFLLLADALLGPAGKLDPPANGSSPRKNASGPAELHYACGLTLDAAAAFRPAAETREGWLEAKNRRVASVIPLALPEWRTDFCHAALTAESGQLLLEQKALGRNLYAPLWIDLDPRRLRRPLTWRRLTVGESLAAVPRDAAAAFRVQAGAEQWVVYRSLARPGNRSFLGHNTHYEFVCHRFMKSADTEPIVEIE